jgi:predicted Zn finger-like uncharacterized protein
MTKPEAPRFICPHCAAEYRVVRVMADPALADREITCRNCGGPLQGREGAFVLKYFMVNRPGLQAPRRRHG